MKLTKFISIQAYLQSQGIAFAKSKDMEKLLQILFKEKEITMESGWEILGYKTNIALTIFRLLQNIGIVDERIHKETGFTLFYLNKLGRKIQKSHISENIILDKLYTCFVNWLPLMIFIKYIYSNPGCNTDTMKKELGSQIFNQTEIVAKSIKSIYVKKGVSKPFNHVIIQNVLSPLALYYNLVEKSKQKGPYYLTQNGKEIANMINLSNLQITNLNKKIDPLKLALLDFVELGNKKIDIILNPTRRRIVSDFIRELKRENQNLDIKINYTESNFEIVATPDCAFWENKNYYSHIFYKQV